MNLGIYALAIQLTYIYSKCLEIKKKKKLGINKRLKLLD